ncbi:MAG TPA: glycine zipper domain-containing protein [Crinalium sp.]
MINEQNEPIEQSSDATESANPHTVAKGIGAASGGLTGAAIGKSVGGKLGATVGGIAGAIAGGMAGEAIAEFTEDLIQEISPSLSLGLGADTKEIELPAHYSWEQLQALSKPQRGDA